MSVTGYIVIGLVAFLGAMLQANMGFGGAVILINFLPLFFPYLKAVALMQGAIVILNLVYMIIYWKKVRWDIIWPAVIPSVIIGLFFSFYSVNFDVQVLKLGLGVVFILLAVYYLAVVDRIHMLPSKINGFFMGTFSGLANALFGFAGPPLALYLVPSIDDKLEYFASSQACFLCSSLACISARLFAGVYEVSDLPNLLYIAVFFFLGIFFGLKILKKIKGDAFKKIIYAFIGLNGVYIIIKQLIGG